MYIPIVSDIYMLVRNILKDNEAGANDALKWLDKVFDAIELY